MSFETETTQRIILLQNPCSTRASELPEVTAQLDDSHWRYAVEPFTTGHPSEVDNVETLANKLRDGDTILSCGGDGLGSIACNALVKSETNAHYIPLPLGNANDGSLSLYGRNIIKRGRFLDLLDRGRSQVVGGIQIELGDQDPRYALGYVSLGLSAYAAERISTPEFREKRRLSHKPDFVIEGQEILRAIKEYDNPLAYIEDDVEQQQVAELMFADQQRMAKVIRFDVPKFGTELVAVELGQDKLLVEIAKKILLDGRPGVVRGETTKRRELAIIRPTKMQLDGEVEDVAADTLLVVEHQPSMIQTLVAA